MSVLQTEQFDDLVLACGSGGTVAGLARGNYLTGEKLRRVFSRKSSVDDLVFACGSRGTSAGLAMGNYLTGEKLR